ncbi:MAG: YggS family pyridoxal phosphate-dependent enzyme [Pseudomonadota bacterium]
MTVADALARLQDRIDKTAIAAGRDPGSVTLVAVSKKQPLERVEAALRAGHRRFGENRVQEAEARWTGLRPTHPDLILHLIGPLQTNKVKPAVALFDVIESIDRPKLARALAREMAASGKRPRCLIQVNTGEEPQKAGVVPADLAALVELCRDALDLPIEGLMCIPPIDEAPAPHFALLAELADRHGLKTLSMGMSGDFETAIRHGATQVRVGSAVFGQRPTDGQ